MIKTDLEILLQLLLDNCDGRCITETAEISIFTLEDEIQKIFEMPNVKIG